MSKQYSTYEAKAKFSEVMQQVRNGLSVIITYRGERVAEIRPLEKGERTIESRLDDLKTRGVLIDSTDSSAKIGSLANKPGALKRFLDERE